MIEAISYVYVSRIIINNYSTNISLYYVIKRGLFLKKPIITIGICVKNAETTIGDTIDSILEQDFPSEPIEIIFVDDGSNDKTLSILIKYVNNIKINSKIFHHEWKGLGPSRNIVINNAEGDYILWVDGDMILMSKDYIRKHIDFMKNNPRIGIVKGKWNLTPSSNWISTLEMYARYTNNLEKDYDNTTKSLGTGGATYRVAAINQVKGFDEKIRGYGEDQDIENRIRKVGWLFAFLTDVKFKDYERKDITWNDLWIKYCKRGYDTHYLMKINKNYIKLSRMTPPVYIFTSIYLSVIMYKITHDKLALLLPINFTFKIMAFWFGLLSAVRSR